MQVNTKDIKTLSPNVVSLSNPLPHESGIPMKEETDGV